MLVGFNRFRLNNLMEGEGQQHDEVSRIISTNGQSIPFHEGSLKICLAIGFIHHALL